MDHLFRMHDCPDHVFSSFRISVEQHSPPIFIFVQTDTEHVRLICLLMTYIRFTPTGVTDWWSNLCSTFWSWSPHSFSSKISPFIELLIFCCFSWRRSANAAKRYQNDSTDKIDSCGLCLYDALICQQTVGCRWGLSHGKSLTGGADEIHKCAHKYQKWNEMVTHSTADK